jgi:hypothetical protein
MREWLADNERGKRAEHRYSAEQFGLSEDELRATFADYRNRFLAN